MKTDINLFRWPLSVIMAFGLVTSLPAAGPSAPTALSQEAMTVWLKGYGEAWETRSADRAVALFSADASYQDDPYKAPHQGHKGIHDYWSGVTKDQRNVKFGFEVLAISGSTGVAHWTAEFDVEPSKTHITLNGVFVLDFGADGKCRSLREWWHLKMDEPAPAAK